jgi:hypothetical protein
MPYIEIDIDEIYGDLGDRDKVNLVEWLKEDGYITRKDLEDTDPQSAVEQLFTRDIDKINAAYLTLSSEDMQTLREIAKRY